jgi:hypothetical protein
MRPYREQDATFYFGRDAEVDELLARTERSLLTLLYARGGLGKTSLLRAGLTPRLVERAYLPVYLRPRWLLDGARDPIAEAIRAVEAAARAGGIEATADFDASSLWELFHRRAFDLWDATNRLVKAVLVFDQFEEIFQLIDDDAAAAPRVRALLEGIAELVENRLPQRLAQSVDPGDAAQHFDVSAKNFRVVLSFREDYLPQVRKLRAIVPSVIENHVRLEPLTGQQALQVVEGAGGGLIDREAATLLVRSVGRPAGLLQRLLEPKAGLAAGGQSGNVEVEPAILSVVCFHLNSERLQRGQSTIDVGLMKLKSPEDIFDDYYSMSTAQISVAARDFVESSLVTPGGERVLYPMRAVTAQRPELLDAVNRMLEQGILRKEWFAGEQRVEISHDLLLRPIKRAIEQRLAGAAQRRIYRSNAIGVAVATAIGVVGLVIYGGYMKIQSEISQREATAAALLVALTPLHARSDATINLQDRMTGLISSLGNMSGDTNSASSLQALFDGAMEFGKSTDPGNARRLQDVAIEYLQLKIEHGRFAQSDVSPVLPKMRQTVEALCGTGNLQKGDRHVTWFADRGGIPASCR